MRTKGDASHWRPWVVRRMSKLADKKKQVLQDRMAGMTCREVAKKNGMSASNVSLLVRSAIKETFQEEAKEYASITLQRLEDLLEAVWARALEGDIDAHEQARKTIADTRAMLGLDKPKRQELTGKEGVPVIDATSFAAKLEEIAKRDK